MKARIINSTKWGGNHQQIWLNNNQNIVLAGQLVSEWELTDILPNSELKKHFWNGSKWVEGLSFEEIKEIELAKIAPLQKIVLDKIKRYSLALAMGKSVNDDLEYFQEAYTTKYEMCKGIKSDPYDSILTESQLEGFPTKKEYVDLVISKFQQGLMFRNVALQMSEVLRKLILNDIKSLDYSKAIARLEVVNQLSDNITIEEVSGIFQQVLNL